MSIFLTSIALISALYAQQTTIKPEEGCSADYAYIYAETSHGGLQQTIPSERVNFAPYAYKETIPRRKLAIFAQDAPFNATHNNPCDVTTWTTAPAHYANTIVAIDYNTDFSAQCSPQQWTLNLELMGAKAVLITDRVDAINLYPLTGDASLSTPTIPTRMIAQLGANQMLAVLEFDMEDLYVSINCLADKTAPPSICVMDDSIRGSNVELDGEFQRQDKLSKNDHPVWLKRGMTSVWDDYYIWLAIDASASLNAWKFVIGKDFNDESSITAECLINEAEYIDDPSLCGNNWYIGNTLSNVSSSDGVCDLSDNFVCASSGSQVFDSYFAGVYRQVHSGVPVWFGDNTAFNAYMSVQFVNLTWFKAYAFTVTHAATNGIYAFCPLSNEEPSRELALEPHKCNANWYTVVQNAQGQYEWFDDPLMDVDLCSHPKNEAAIADPDIVYPTQFCMKDTNDKYSHYQTYYGVYTLDATQKYDGRLVYRNERLKDNLDEWYMVYYDEKDAWIINAEIPSLTYTSTFGGICRSDVGTPDQCTACWQFYEGLHDEINCDVRIETDTNAIANCVPEPVNSLTSYTDVASLCFDGDFGDILTGKWEIEPVHHHNYRRYWSLNGGEYFLWYDSSWRFWVIHTDITLNEEEFSFYCLKWDEFEPFNCDTWHAKDGSTISMMECSMAPTLSPTPHPTAHCLASNMYVSAHANEGIFGEKTLHSSPMNFPPYAGNTFFDIPLIEFEQHTLSTGNPCDASTWVLSATEYENKVVLIDYSDFYNGLCTPQQWTLQLEMYADVKGVVIANDADFNYVYPLNGDDSLSDPTIPTRMISQLDRSMITHAFARNEEVLIDFGCFDEFIDYPSTICLIDTSIVGKYVYLDGEYHRDASLMANDHPVWIKRGHVGLWETVYMFLDVDVSVKYESSLRWVIGSTIDDVIAVCDVEGVPLNDPSQCFGHWMINGTLNENITTSNTQCALGDNYVCVESTSGGFFEQYFAGKYRQVHDGVSLWLYESEDRDVHIQPASVYWPQLNNDLVYGFAFVVNQSESYAFCVIGVNYPTREQVLSPELCNDEWWVMEYDDAGNEVWQIDLAFDVDPCQHANISTTQVEIDYPPMLCLNDPTNAQSHYQSHYGIYVLDTEQTFDGKYVYKNQRLDGQHDEWYMLWYDEKDAWVLNELIPGNTIVQNTNGICKEDVATPDLCTQCWQFYEGYEVESNCNIEVKPIASNLESDCVMQPVDEIETYSDKMDLCFDDGVTAEFMNPYTGKWHLHGTYGGRAKWILADSNNVIRFYMFYDAVWRFWVIDQMLGRSDANNWQYIHYYCPDWRAFEPFACDTWYSSVKGSGGQLLPGFDGQMTMKTDCKSDAPSQAPTPSPTVKCDAMNSFVSIRYDQYDTAEETVTSYHTNFAPFAFDTFANAELVLFEDGRPMTDASSNPCDYRTWQEFPSFYENKVVLIDFSGYFDAICSVEFWTLNLEQYGGAKAVLIGNAFDLHHVYAISGRADILDPQIPTKMISQFAAQHIGDLFAVHSNPRVTFDCFDDVAIEYPALICLVDTSPLGDYVYLDGEYQRQAHHLANDHPVWMKEGHEGLWSHMYMWLEVDQSIDGDHAMAWVIGTDTVNVVARCIVKSNEFEDSAYYISHPALCDGHWFVEGQMRDTIITSDTSCSFGDNYVCVESADGGLFDTYFDGQYRQIHSGVPLWLFEDTMHDAYLTVGRLNMPPLFDNNEYAFAFMLNQTTMFAFCVIGEELPSDAALLKPWECNDDWYKVEIINDAYQWVVDYAFDIDRCVHSQIAIDFPSLREIEYPNALCMHDETNSLSPHQSHYGVYVLDNSTTFDGKFVYKNQRLDGQHDEWYMLWYDEQDSWVVNEMVPEITAVRNHEGICDEEVDLPSDCKQCWQFYDANGESETMCSVKVEVTTSLSESDCMALPVNDALLDDGDYVQQIMLGFDDEKYTGEWILSESEFNGRKYWYKLHHHRRRRLLRSDLNIEYFMFYDATWRYWVIASELGGQQQMYCLNWFDFQPFEACDTWYIVSSGLTMSMDNAYIAPTVSTTQAPSITTVESTTTTTTTAQPSIAPTLAVHIHKVTEKQVTNEEQINSDGAFHVSWMIWTISACVIVWGLCCVVYHCKKQRKEKKSRVDFKNVNSAVYGISSPASEDINLSMVQMNNFRYGAGTIGSATGTGTKGKGEIIAMDDSDASSDDDVVVQHTVLDGTEGDDVTLQDSDDNDAFIDDLDDEENDELYGKNKTPTKQGGHKKRKSWVKF